MAPRSPETSFRAQHPHLHKAFFAGKVVLGVGLSVDMALHGIADAQVSPPDIASATTSADVLKASVEFLKGVELNCFAQYGVSDTIRVKGKNTLLPTQLPFSDTRTEEKTVVFNPDGGIIAFVYTCLKSGSVKMTINPNAKQFNGDEGAANTDPIVTLELDKAAIETILSPARGVNPREFDRSSNNPQAFLAGAVALLVQYVPPEKRGAVLQELSGDTFQNILDSTAKEDGYKIAEDECKEALLNNPKTWSILEGFIAQMTVTQYNQEHPDKPITVRDVVFKELLAGTPLPVTKNQTAPLVTGKGASDLKNMQNVTAGYATVSVGTPDRLSGKCELSQTVVDKNVADMPAQTTSSTPTPNSAAKTQSASPSPLATTTPSGGR